MRSSIFFSALFFLSYCFAAPTGTPDSTVSPAAPSPVAPSPSPAIVPNEFVVVLKNKDRVRNDEEHKAWVLQVMNEQFKDDATSVNIEYDFGTWQAYSITGPQALVDVIAADADVDWVQPVRNLQSYAENRNPIPGLRRISSRNLPAAGAPYLFPNSAGEGVDVYIVDTGIRADHPEFEGRAIFAKSFVNNDERVDGNGHGTHVAGTVGSKSFGVAPKATLIGVRVLDAEGSGRSDAILQGLNFVRTSAAERRRPSVVNMSLGGGADRALDRLVTTLHNSGIVVVVAAGNDNQDACGDSPGRAPAVITVGASDPRNDVQASFSNTGTCVDIVAPGVNIKSTWIGNSRTDGDNGITNTISGTSMACPHVAGAVALMLADQPNLTPPQVAQLLIQSATPNVLRVRNQTPNLLLFNGGVAGFSLQANSLLTVPVPNPASTVAAVAPTPTKRSRQGSDPETFDFENFWKALFGIIKDSN